MSLLNASPFRPKLIKIHLAPQSKLITFEYDCSFRAGQLKRTEIAMGQANGMDSLEGVVFLARNLHFSY